MGGHFTKQTTVFSLVLWLLRSLASTVVKARVLTGSTRDNNRKCDARLIITQWYGVYDYTCTTMSICFMLTTLAYRTEGLHFSAFIIILLAVTDVIHRSKV